MIFVYCEVNTILADGSLYVYNFASDDKINTYIYETLK